ncbi:molybdopterin-dependent oxidoreductase [Deferribacter thermophilus]|uniref:molybdopterin-containing oxidoreductase family protein n=1 Tax=Deferribacter thermophilus TaxID=53573 RepID=UPI003C299D0C
MPCISRRNFLKLGVASAISSNLLSIQKSYASVSPVDFGVEKKVPVLCRMCAQFCPMLAVVLDGRVIRIESNKHTPHSGICARGRSAMGALYNPDRVKYPLIRVGKRGEGKFRRATWDEALNMIASKLKELKRNNEEHLVAFLPRFNSAPEMDKQFFKIYGTPNIVGYGDTCFGNSLIVSFGAIFGGKEDHGVPGGGTGALTPDYENAKYGLLINRNPGGGLVTFPWGVMFGRGKRNGLKVTVVDPRKPSEAGESLTDWLPIRPGTDLAFLLALSHLILTNDSYNKEFLMKYTNAAMLVDSEGKPVYTEHTDDKHFDYLVFDEADKSFKLSHLAQKPALLGSFEYNGQKVKTALTVLKESSVQYTPEWAEKITSIPAAKIRQVAENLVKNSPQVFIERGYRSVRYLNSMEEKKVILMLNVLLGNIGAKGGMIIQRKVETASYLKTPKPKTKSISIYYRDIDEFSLINTSDYRRIFIKSLLDEKPYKCKMAVFWGQNIIGGSTGGEEIIKALEKLEMIVAVTPFFNETALYADIIIPDAMFLERDEAIRTKFKTPYPVVAVHKKAVDPLFEAKDGYWIVLELAKRVFDEETYDKYFKEFEEKGIKSIWEKQLSHLKGLDEKEKSEFSISSLFEKGVWTGHIKYGVKAKTKSKKIELYSTFLQKKYLEMKPKNEKLSLLLDPKFKYVDPYWRTFKNNLGSDEFVPVTGFNPLSSFTGAQTRNNPILKVIGEMVDWDAVYINKEKGEKLGLKDGDMVEIFNIERPHLATLAKVKLVEHVHPDAMFSYYGVGAGYYKKYNNFLTYAPKYGFNPNHIGNFNFAPLDGGQLAQDFIVKIRRPK